MKKRHSVEQIVAKPRQADAGTCRHIPPPSLGRIQPMPRGFHAGVVARQLHAPPARGRAVFMSLHECVHAEFTHIRLGLGSGGRSLQPIHKMVFMIILNELTQEA